MMDLRVGRPGATTHCYTAMAMAATQWRLSLFPRCSSWKEAVKWHAHGALDVLISIEKSSDLDLHRVLLRMSVQ